MKYWVLDQGGKIRQARSIDEWAKFMQTDTRLAFRTTRHDGTLVSTVFLGINHRFGPGEPILWETMVFDSDGLPVEQVRCAGSIEQAREQHARECAKLGIDPWQNKADV